MMRELIHQFPERVKLLKVLFHLHWTVKLESKQRRSMQSLNHTYMCFMFHYCPNILIKKEIILHKTKHTRAFIFLIGKEMVLQEFES